MATRYRVACTECPFDRKYSSQAHADRGFRLHSCARYRALVPLTAAEKTEVVHRLIAAGVPKNEIERRTGVNPHRVLAAAETKAS